MTTLRCRCVFGLPTRQDGSVTLQYHGKNAVPLLLHFLTISEIFVILVGACLLLLGHSSEQTASSLSPTRDIYRWCSDARSAAASLRNLCLCGSCPGRQILVNSWVVGQSARQTGGWTVRHYWFRACALENLWHWIIHCCWLWLSQWAILSECLFSARTYT